MKSTARLSPVQLFAELKDSIRRLVAIGEGIVRELRRANDQRAVLVSTAALTAREAATRFGMEPDAFRDWAASKGVKSHFGEGAKGKPTEAYWLEQVRELELMGKRERR